MQVAAGTESGRRAAHSRDRAVSEWNLWPAKRSLDLLVVVGRVGGASSPTRGRQGPLWGGSTQPLPPQIGEGPGKSPTVA